MQEPPLQALTWHGLLGLGQVEQLPPVLPQELTLVRLLEALHCLDEVL